MLLSLTGTVVPFRPPSLEQYGPGLADRSPMVNAQYYSSSGIGLINSFASYAELYRRQTWVHVLVNKVATSGSRLPLKVFRRVSDTDRENARDSPYGQLMRKPNRRLGAKGLWLWVQSTRELYGEAILVKLRHPITNLPIELLPLHPTNVIVRDDPDNPGAPEYLYMPGGMASKAGAVRFKATEVIHFRGYNPDNTHRGLSACEPLRETLLSEDAMRRGASALWRNGARPSVLLTTEKGLSDEAIDRISAQWDAAHSGIDSWGKTAVLEEGVKPTVIQMNPDDMQYLSGRQLNREECCAVWDVPPPAVQILDRATFSNITEQMRSLYRETMGWRVEAYEDTLANQLAQDFAADGSLYSEFLMDSVLRGSFETRTTAKAQAIQTGQMTPAEARADENLPFIPGSDKLMVNAALVPMDVSPPGEAKAVKPADLTTMLQKIYLAVDKVITVDEARDILNRAGANLVGAGPVMKSVAARDLQKVDRRLDAAGSIDAVDEAALLAGLSADDDVRALLRAAVATGADIPTLRSWLAGAAFDLTMEAVQ